MTRKTASIAPLLLALVCAQAAARQLPEPKLTPTPSNEKQTALIREGVALHERGDYDGAVRKYEEVLAENPSNTVALYEMGYALFAKKDYKRSLEVGYRGAQYKSDQLGHILMLVGNNLDQLGEPQKAVEAYKKGIKLFPADGMLHFNLAITYRNMKKPEESRKSLKAAVTHSPTHASSHLALAVTFFEGGYRVPAFFAAARFLTLEPSSQRSAAAARIMTDVLRGGATKGSKPNEINLALDLSAKKDEGDFSTVDLVMGLSGAMTLSEEKGKAKTQAQLLAEQVGTVLGLLEEDAGKKKQSSFTHQYYLPYFVELKRKGHAEAFTYHTLQATGLPGVREWLEANSGRVMQFLIWSKGYQWPKDVKL